MKEFQKIEEVKEVKNIEELIEAFPLKRLKDIMVWRDGSTVLSNSCSYRKLRFYA